MLLSPVGTEPTTCWTPVRCAYKWATEAGWESKQVVTKVVFLVKKKKNQQKFYDVHLVPLKWKFIASDKG